MSTKDQSSHFSHSVSYILHHFNLLQFTIILCNKNNSDVKGLNTGDSLSEYEYQTRIFNFCHFIHIS